MRSIIVSMVVVAVMASCALPASALNVVADTSTVGYFAREIGGDRVNVTVICPGTSNPHFLETTPGHVRATANANVFLEVGLGLAPWTAPLRRAARNPNLRVVTTSAGVTVLEKPTGTVDPSQGHMHPQGNPHIHLHPNNAMRMCSNILAGYRAADPRNADYYTQRTRSLLNRIQNDSAKWRNQMAPHRGAGYVSYHASYEYLANFLGLTKVATIEPKPGVPPSSARVTNVINLVKNRNVRLLLQEPYYPPGAARSIAASTNAKLVTLPVDVGGVPGTATWFSLMEHNVTQIRNALR